ncbi:hypothetical protein [Muriicola sp. Z0-33]|uniref:hypothetical protein n=1 Tax=Muriicola sp. Z0-33 TaxID=2816957 RepID=UPI0022380904|nr:hypothetical protein [Muriicola sp. Z0-33]MCW5515710.1 hypothetical protein [Muriicola sp. Z0-33]
MIKQLLFLCFLFSCTMALQGQLQSTPKAIVITSKKKKTKVHTNDHGELLVNVSRKNVAKFKTRGYVQYSDFDSVGDGKTDDTYVIAATHAFANRYSLSVRADEGASYYIGGIEQPVVIQTDTYFGTANFIIDDTEVQNKNAAVFLVSSKLEPFKINGITSLKRNQEKIKADLPGACLVTVTDDNTKHYIRVGQNENNGSSKMDNFVVDQNGDVDMDSPVIWDFDQITDLTAIPIDKETLKISGGRFTTIANKAESKRNNYYSRNMAIRRSNVIVDGLEHHVTGEGDQGGPYRGFLNISDCANVTIKNTILTGRKTYQRTNSEGKPFPMGSYDILLNRTLNVSFVNCSQTNDIHDKTYWGILGSNYCKNLLYDNCSFSRFDAHKGVANITIRNSTLGYMGINAIGTGNLIVENSSIYAKSLINLRNDYGSTWEGEIIIRNCLFEPRGGVPPCASLIRGVNTGQHNFGYTCYMPEQILIDNLHIDDSKLPADHKGPTIFADFNPEMTDATYQEEFPYIKTKQVIVRNTTTATGKPLRFSYNPFMFKDVKLDTN